MIFLILFVLTSTVYHTPRESQLTLIYFTSSECPYSSDPEHIANINKIRSELGITYNQFQIKFVMVIMDEDINKGFQFYKKHGHWHEVSIGQRYKNELMLAHINHSPIPGVPQIIIYFDLLKFDHYNVPSIDKRTLMLDLMGKSKINNWINNGYRFEHI